MITSQKTRVLIIGAGGHGQVVADIFAARAKNGFKETVSGFIDDNKQLKGKKILGIPVLGGVSEISGFPHEAFIVAIGENKTRKDIFNKLKALKENPINALHLRSISRLRF